MSFARSRTARTAASSAGPSLDDIARRMLPFVPALVAVLLIGRRPAALFRPQLWAEDGPVYIAPALLHGAGATLLVPYAGYLQVVARLATALAVALPALLVPGVLALVSIAIAAGSCSLFAAPRYRGVVGSDALRLGACLAIACAIPMSEVFGTITNAHWYLSLAAGLLLLAPPADGRLVRWRDGSIAGLAAISGAELLVLAPLALWRAARERGGARTVPLVVLAGLAIQVAVLAVDYHGTRPERLATVALATAYGYAFRVVVATVAGLGAADALPGERLRVAVAAASLALAGIGIAIVGVTARRARVAFGCCIGFGVAWVAAAMDGRDIAPMFAGVHTLLASTHNGGRYFVLPAAALVLGVAVVLDRETRLPLNRKAAILGAAFVLGALHNYRLDALPDIGWTRSAPALERWERARRTGTAAPAVTVPINPPGWALTLPALP